MKDTRCESVSVTAVLLRLSRSCLMGLSLTSVHVLSCMNFFIFGSVLASILSSFWYLHDAHAHNDIIGKLPSLCLFVAEYPLSGGILYLVMAVRFYLMLPSQVIKEPGLVMLVMQCNVI